MIFKNEEEEKIKDLNTKQKNCVYFISQNIYLLTFFKGKKDIW